MADLPDADLEALPPAADGGDDAVWRRLRAGMLVELGLASRKVARRWQAEVAAGRFDPDACAEEILATSAVTHDGETQLRSRAARLQRDLLMAPTLKGLRGAGRRVRERTRGLVAFVVAQVVTVTMLLAIVLVGMLVARLGFGFGFDAFLDSIGAVFGA